MKTLEPLLIFWKEWLKNCKCECLSCQNLISYIQDLENEHLHQTIELIGGPLDGTIHKLQGTMIPEAIGLPDNEGKKHWYNITPRHGILGNYIEKPEGK